MKARKFSGPVLTDYAGLSHARNGSSLTLCGASQLAEEVVTEHGLFSRQWLVPGTEPRASEGEVTCPGCRDVLVAAEPYFRKGRAR